MWVQRDGGVGLSGSRGSEGNCPPHEKAKPGQSGHTKELQNKFLKLA